MMTAYSIFKEDIESLTNCFAKFNSTYSDLKKAFKEVTGQELNIGDNAVEKSSKALQWNMAEELKRHDLDLFHLKINIEYLGSNWNRSPPGFIRPLMKMFHHFWPA